MRINLLAAGVALTAAMFASQAQAGKVYLTGHDPDFHAQGQASGQLQLNVALNYVTNGTYNDGVHKFLFVESELAPTPGHLIGENGLGAIGLTEGVNYDEVDAAGLAALPSFKGYSAIVVASSFGGMLTDAEIRELVVLKGKIATFVNGGGGLAAFAECAVGNPACNADLVTPTTPLFGFVPVTATSVDTVAPYKVTPFGAGLGLTDAAVSDCCTHNSFLDSAGLNIVDVDQLGTPTTLAGSVSITGGGFGVPEPATWALMLVGFGGLGVALRSRRRMAAA